MTPKFNFDQEFGISSLKCSNPDCGADVLHVVEMSIRSQNFSNQKCTKVLIRDGAAILHEESLGSSEGYGLAAVMRCFICDHTFEFRLSTWRSKVLVSADQAKPLQAG